jgi:hypothetical protein
LPGQNIRDLETLLATVRLASAELLNLDMYDRWGGGRDEAMNRKMERGGEFSAAKSSAQERLNLLVPQLRKADPQAVESWADAWIKLLTGFSAETEDSTAKFVADEEIGEWEKVKNGSLNFPEQNTFYIRLNPLKYAEAFGAINPEIPE